MNKNWIYSTLVFVSGLLLVICPNFCANFFVIILGLCAVVAGFYDLTQGRMASSDENYQRIIMIKGVTLIVVGLISAILPFPVKAAFKAMTYILAVFLVLSALAGFVTTGIIRNEVENRKTLIMENLLSLLAAAVLILIRLTAFIRIIGIIVLVAGIIYIAFTVLESRNNLYATDIAITDDDSE